MKSTTAGPPNLPMISATLPCCEIGEKFQNVGQRELEFAVGGVFFQKFIEDSTGFRGKAAEQRGLLLFQAVGALAPLALGLAAPHDDPPVREITLFGDGIRGQCPEPAFWSFGTMNFRQVSASLGMGGGGLPFPGTGEDTLRSILTPEPVLFGCPVMAGRLWQFLAVGQLE